MLALLSLMLVLDDYISNHSGWREFSHRALQTEKIESWFQILIEISLSQFVKSVIYEEVAKGWNTNKLICPTPTF